MMEEKDVQRLLDMLYGMVDEAKSAAFSSDKCVINRDEVLDLLDEIRGKMPLEMKKAQELIRARDEYVAAAKQEVEKMLRQAQLDAKTIVSESEILQQAGTNAAAAAAQNTLKIRYVCIVLAAVPIFCITPFVQKYLVSGTMLGAVKG